MSAPEILAMVFMSGIGIPILLPVMLSLIATHPITQRSGGHPKFIQKLTYAFLAS